MLSFPFILTPLDIPTTYTLHSHPDSLHCHPYFLHSYPDSPHCHLYSPHSHSNSRHSHPYCPHFHSNFLHSHLIFAFPPWFSHSHPDFPHSHPIFHIPWISHISTPIPRIPILLIPFTLTLITRIPTLIPYIPNILLILFPQFPILAFTDSPRWMQFSLITWLK